MTEQTPADTTPAAPVRPTVRSRRAPFELTIFCTMIALAATVGIVYSAQPIDPVMYRVDEVCCIVAVIITLTVAFVRALPAAAVGALTALVSIIAAPIVLNAVIMDEASTVTYPAYFTEKSVSHSKYGNTYNATYQAANSRVYHAEITDQAYYADTYPEVITMKEQRGLMGWTVDATDAGTIYDRTFWTLFALCICFSTGIWQYTRYNIDFRRRYGNIAIFIMAISALLPYAETTPIVLYLALGGTALGALLCFALMANYHIARRGPAVMADIVARREPRYLRGPRTRDTLYTYTFAIHDPDFEFEWGEERGTILGPVTTPGLPVRIDRGRLGMRIIRPI